MKNLQRNLKNVNSPTEYKNGKSLSEYKNEKSPTEYKNGKLSEYENGKSLVESKNGESLTSDMNKTTPLTKNGYDPKNNSITKNGFNSNNSITKNGSTKISFEVLQNLEQSEDIMSIPSWELEPEYQPVIDKEKKEAMTLLKRHMDSLPKRKKRDPWDKELDQGRQKKVRKKNHNQVSTVNKFQEKFKQISEKKEF